MDNYMPWPDAPLIIIEFGEGTDIGVISTVAQVMEFV